MLKTATRLLLPFALVLAVSLVAAEGYISGAGPTGSVPSSVFVYAYYVGPAVGLFAALGILIYSVVTALRLIWRRVWPDRAHGASLLSGLAAFGLLYAAPIAMEEVRVRNLESNTAPLESPLLDYTVAHNNGTPAAVPTLNIRGCTSLDIRVVPDENRWELWAECSRGIGSWDELVYRPYGSFPESPRWTLWGKWGYFWD